jgi:uncharacterized membrane protein YfcA
MQLYLLLGFFGVLSGVTTVLFGFGGGFVVVPVLYATLVTTHGLHDAVGAAAMHIAVATSTCVMIVNAVVATQRHRRAGNIRRDYVWPLAGFIGIGAVIGAGLVLLASSTTMRYAFVVYLGITIVDCLLRKGFLARGDTAAPRALGTLANVAGGTLIGTVATFLGVGGSVMTVPLLRRCGLPMKQAAAMANPLTLPVALVGTATYMASALLHPTQLAPWIVGYVDLLAFACLSLGSVAGIRLAAPLMHRIPDQLHARIYVGLLVAVLVSMTVPRG